MKVEWIITIALAISILFVMSVVLHHKEKDNEFNTRFQRSY